MLARCLCCVAVLAGCGRFGFDGHDGGSTGGDGPHDGRPPVETRVIPAVGATTVLDAVFDADGNLAVSGSFDNNLEIGGMSIPTGAALSDMFVAVLDPAGTATRLWRGGVTQLATGQNLAWLPDGSLVAAGYFAGTLTGAGNLAASGRQAALVLLFDPNGTLRLARHYQASGNVQARGADATASRIAVVGVYAGAVDFGAGPLPATVEDNGFLATMDLDGTNVRSRAFLGNSDVYVNDITIGPGGDIYIVGRFNAATDFGLGTVSPLGAGSSSYVARYDAQLAPRWVRTFGSATSTTTVAVLANGDCVAGGEVTDTISIDGHTVSGAGSRDGWVAQFSAATGAVSWLHGLGGPGDDTIASVTVHADQIAIAGHFESTALLAEATTLTSDGLRDGIVAGFGLDGALAWSAQLGGTGNVDLGIGGISIDALGTRAAVPLVFTGEMIVDGQIFTGGTSDGAAILVGIPQ